MSAWLIVAVIVYIIIAAIWFGVTTHEYLYYRDMGNNADDRAKWARLVLLTPLWPVGVLDILGAFLGEVSEAARDRVEEEEQR